MALQETNALPSRCYRWRRHPLENEDESGRSLCEYCGTNSQARIEGERHHLHETILRYVQEAFDDIRWEIDRNEFDELMITKKVGVLEGWGLHLIQG